MKTIPAKPATAVDQKHTSHGQETVRQAYEAFRAFDVPRFLGALSKDATLYFAAEVPWRGAHQGLEAIGEFFAGVRNAPFRAQIELGEISGAGRHFTVEAKETLTMLDATGNPRLDTNGKPLTATFEFLDKVTLDGSGKISKIASYYDGQALRSMLAPPTQGQAKDAFVG